jgi:signal peptidase I
MTTPRSPTHSTSVGRLRRVGRAAATLALVGGLVVACATIVPALLGYERYAIVSGSMGGSYDRGSVVYAETVAVSELAVGDVITYSPPPGEGPDGLVTHRIAAIELDRDGEQVFRTKGDANRHVDPWKFQLDQPTQARASFGVPYLGYAIAALSIREVRLLVIGLPALLIGLMLLSRMWREAGEELRRREGSADAGVATP